MKDNVGCLIIFAVAIGVIMLSAEGCKEEHVIGTVRVSIPNDGSGHTTNMWPNGDSPDFKHTMLRLRYYGISGGTFGISISSGGHQAPVPSHYPINIDTFRLASVDWTIEEVSSAKIVIVAENVAVLAGKESK